MVPPMIKTFVCEFLATMWLCSFAHIGCVCIKSISIGNFLAAVACGLLIATPKISFGFKAIGNPVIMMACYAFDQLPSKNVTVSIFAQVLGGFVAAFLVRFGMPVEELLQCDGLCCAASAGESNTTKFLMLELHFTLVGILSFFLISQLRQNFPRRHFLIFVCELIIEALIMAATFLAGMSTNPARSLTTAILEYSYRHMHLCFISESAALSLFCFLWTQATTWIPVLQAPVNFEAYSIRNTAGRGVTGGADGEVRGAVGVGVPVRAGPRPLDGAGDGPQQ